MSEATPRFRREGTGSAIADDVAVAKALDRRGQGPEALVDVVAGEQLDDRCTRGGEREIGRGPAPWGPTMYSASAKARTCSAGDSAPGSMTSKPRGAERVDELRLVLDPSGVLRVAAAHVEATMRRDAGRRAGSARGARGRSTKGCADRRRAETARTSSVGPDVRVLLVAQATIGREAEVVEQVALEPGGPVHEIRVGLARRPAAAARGEAGRPARSGSSCRRLAW